MPLTGIVAYSVNADEKQVVLGMDIGSRDTGSHLDLLAG